MIHFTKGTDMTDNNPSLSDARRIIVLGCSGCGKSTFATKLHAKTGIPLYHLDNVWWKPDRTHISRDEFDRRLGEIVSGSELIIEGDYSRTYEVRIRASDAIVFLDIDEDECMKGITERVGKKRDDIPWTEHELDPELVALVREYKGKNRPVLLDLFEKYPDKQKLIFSSRKEADDWLSKLK